MEIAQLIDQKISDLFAVTERALTIAAEGQNGKYGTTERDSWSRTQAQARAYLDDPLRNIEKAPDLTQEAWSSSGRSGSFRSGSQADINSIKPLVEKLATRIIEKASSLGEVAAAIKGNRNRLEGELQSLKSNPSVTIEQVADFNIFQGFPPELL